MMELTTLNIYSSFKNLKGLHMSFKGEESTYVLIGNNGSGKSSVLEAISSILATLYDSTKQEFEFDFTLVYTIREKKIALTCKNKKLKVKIDGKESTLPVLRNEYLPSRVICNYSGEDTRMKEKYYTPLYDEYVSRLKDAGGQNVLRMVFVDKDVWQIILLIMLACRQDLQGFGDFLDNTLMLPPIDKIHIEIDNKQLDAWKDNAVTYYVRQILKQADANGNLGIAQVNPANEEPFSLFNLWNSARPLITRLDITFEGGIDSLTLSEGEKKLMVVLFILEAVADESSLVLLDEPDSHIHVARKNELKKFFDDSVNRKNILTSHSPTLTAKFPKKAIIMLDRKADGLVAVVEKDKQEIVAQLTNGFWTLQEQNIFLASNKTILVVEGKTDETILDTALKSLQRNGRFSRMDFSYLPCGGASNVPVLVDKFIPKQGQKMIAFFDADKAGWNAIRDIFQDKKLDSENFGKARKEGNVWCSTYPSCKKNVTIFNLEDYFPRQVFLRYVMKFKSLKELCTEKNIKNKMEEDCKNGRMTDKQLKNFATFFERVQEILDAEADGRTRI